MEIARHWRLKSQRYRLEGLACPHCGQRVFPPRPVCPYCKTHRMGVDWEEIQQSAVAVEPAELLLRYRITERLMA